jgi:O-antigen/teichoic acid export membrane protein
MVPPRLGQRVNAARRSVLVIAGNAGYAGAQAGVLLVLAHTTSPTEMGWYALALALTAPVQIGLGLRLRTVRAVDLSQTPFCTYQRLALMLATLAVVVSSAVGLTVADDPRPVTVIVVVALSKGVESLVDLCYGEYQRHNQLSSIAASQLVRAIATVVLAAAGALAFGLLGSLTAMVLGWTAQLLLLDRRRLPRGDPVDLQQAPARASLDLLRTSWPLGLAGATASLTVALPRFVVNGQLDAAALGLFAILSYPTTVLALLANSVGQAHVRSMTAAARDRRLNRLLGTFLRTIAATLALGAGTAVLVIVVGVEGIEWLLGASYTVHLPLVLLLILAATLSGLATNAYYLLISTSRFGLQPLIIAVSLVTAAPLLHVATARHGLLGTAAAMSFLYIVQGLLTAIAAAVVLRRDARTEPSTRQEIP